MWKTKIPYRLIDFSARIHPAGNWVIGVKRLSDVGGSGTWTWIDENDNSVALENGYFESHPSFKLKDVNLDGNEMVAIPKFYVKSDGNSRYWISPEPRDGFHVHPAFMSKGLEKKDTMIDVHGIERDNACIYIGKWQSWIDYAMLLDSKPKMWSIPSFNEDRIELFENIRGIQFNEQQKESLMHLQTLYPTVDATYWDNWHAADAWNDHSPDGSINVVGYHMMNVWDWSALQWLALIEGGTTNASLRFGEGYLEGKYLDTVDGDATMSANFHGIYGLWGNVWQWIQGVQTRYDGSLWIWDSIGNEIWKETGHVMPTRKSETAIWSEGENCGCWRQRLLASGWNFDTSDMFLPDTSSLVSDPIYGCFSDGIWCRTRSTSKHLYACAVGGSYDSGYWGGMFGWNFDLRLGTEIVKNGVLTEETRWTYPTVASRLCFAPQNLPGAGG